MTSPDADPGNKQRPGVELRQKLETLWRVLTEPASTVQEIEPRRQARLLAAFLVVLMPLGLLSIVIQLRTVPGFGATFRIVLLALAVLFLAYALSRTSLFRVGAVLIAVIPSLASLASIAANPTDVIAYGFLLFSVLLGSVFLPIWTTLLLASANVVALLLLPPFIPLLTYESMVGGPLPFVLMASALILVTTRHRNLVEEDRRAELARSEEWFRQIAENIREVFYVSDRKASRMVYVSPVYEEIWGRPSAELHGDPLAFTNTIHPDDRGAVRDAVARQMFGERTEQEYRILRPEGGVRWIYDRAFPISLPTGEVYRVTGLAEDVTARKEVELALQQSELRFRSLIENTLDIIVVLGAEGQFLFVSPSVERILQYAPTEIVGRQLLDIIHPDDRAQVLEQLSRAFGDPGYLSSVECRVRQRDGRWRTMDAIGSVQQYDGHPRAIVTARDITERRQMEEMASRLGRIIEESLTEIFIFDATTLRFVQVNRGARVNLGYSMEALGTMTPLDIKPEFTPETFELLLAPLRSNARDKIQVTTRHRREDGSTYPVEIHLQLSSLESSPVFVAFAVDLTERRRLEEQIQQQDRLAAVGQLAAGIAHDFNNILAVILLYAELVEQTGRLQGKNQERVVMIQQQAERASLLINQILDFSRRSVIERSLFELTPFLEAYTELLKRTLPENIAIRLTVSNDPLLVNADPTRLQQVLMNLSLNARDSMPHGGDLSIDLRRFRLKRGQAAPFGEMQPGNWIRLSVGDTGRGIEPEHLAHVFEPFFTTKRPGEGTGLGLAQVYGIVRQHDGFIGIESRAGKGTVFTIYLPAFAPAGLTPPEAPQAAERPIAGNGETILVVEDRAETRRALQESLEQVNYRVLQAADGVEALALLEAHHDEIDLVLTDLVMPRMGGRQLLQLMAQRDLRVPAIMLTGHPLDREGDHFGGDGLVAWMLKPPSLLDLTLKVAEALAGAGTPSATGPSGGS